jgi:hypothetical protein
MLRILCAAAVLGLTLGQDMPGIETKDGNVVFIAPADASFVKEKLEEANLDELQKETGNLADALGSQGAAVEDIKGQGAASLASSGKILAASGEMNKVTAQAARIMDSLEDVQIAVDEAMVEGAAVHNHTVTMLVNEMNDVLTDAFDKLKATLGAQADVLTDEYQAKLISANNVSDILGVSAAQISSDIDAYEACSEQGQLYRADTGECGDPLVDPKKIINKVYHRMFSNTDGRDNGYVNERYISFTKYNDDTYMRIFYFDNFRVHGHHAHAMWNIMICDENGNGCDHCSDPGRLMNWRWAGHQSNWWMNDHVGQTVTGLCKKGGSRDMRKGKYRLRVMIDSNYYDMFTGHNQQQNNFMVDEVMKY